MSVATGSPDAAVPPAGVGPLVDSEGVTFQLSDPERHLGGVRLVQEVAHPRSGPAFGYYGRRKEWSLRLKRPPVDRMEYKLQLDTSGGTDWVLDPGNPLHAPGAFGPKSVIEFPGYQPPPWSVDEPKSSGEVEQLTYHDPDLAAPMPIWLWSSAGSAKTQRLPLLVVHDGIEFAEFSGLLRMLDALTDDGTLPSMRAALLHPGPRDEQYSASPGYAKTLTHGVLPYLRDLAPLPPERRMRVAMGASMGALAMLHTHRAEPASFGGLFLQSGSFFHHRYDRFDLDWEHFSRIRRFMDRLHADREWLYPIPVTITCGTVEMNRDNNRATADVLRRQGYEVEYREVRDGHNWIGWRDAWTPGLVDLLRRLWS